MARILVSFEVVIFDEVFLSPLFSLRLTDIERGKFALPDELDDFDGKVVADEG